MQNLERNQQQGIVEGFATTSSRSTTTTTSNQEKGGDEEDANRSPIPAASTCTPSIPPQHFVLKEERKVKKLMQQQSSQGSVNQAADSNHDAQQPHTEILPATVGAIPVVTPMLVGASSSVRALSVASDTEAGTVSSTHDSTTTLSIVNARVVDDEESHAVSAPVVVEATAMDESEPTYTHHLKAVLNNRKCRIISVLTLALFVGLIVAVVLLTQNMSTASSNSSASQTPPVDDETNPSPSPVGVRTPPSAPSKPENNPNPTPPAPTKQEVVTPSPSDSPVCTTTSCTTRI